MSPQIVFLLNKALESLRCSNLESAELYLKQALKLNSRNSHALRLLGVIFAQRKQYMEAIKHLKDSVRADPQNSVALSNLGNVFLELKDYVNALDAYEKSIKVDSKYAEAWSNKGNALFELQRYEEAIAHHDVALRLDPKYAEAWSNKGNALHELGLLQEAIFCHNNALILKPSHYDAYWNKSHSLLLQGDFENGLPLYESRWQSKDVSEIAGKRSFEEPTWLGTESLRDKTILLYGEQGIGDFIQFCRYVKLVAALGAKVILETPKNLSLLMEGLDGVSQLVVKGSDLPFFDYQCPLMSLPLAFNTSISSIPSEQYYLKVGPNKVSEWKLKLGKKRNKRIGLVWSSMSSFRADSKRSLKLEDFIKALPADGFEYICLQKELKICDEEFFKSHTNIRFCGDELVDLSDTAALIENLDLVISTCTSIPHLSAALGKETWILLSYVPDWRWFLDRADSPWYPSVKLFRQAVINDWGNVFEEIKFKLLDSL